MLTQADSSWETRCVVEAFRARSGFRRTFSRCRKRPSWPAGPPLRDPTFVVEAEFPPVPRNALKRRKVPPFLFPLTKTSLAGLWQPLGTPPRKKSYVPPGRARGGNRGVEARTVRLRPLDGELPAGFFGRRHGGSLIEPAGTPGMKPPTQRTVTDLSVRLGSAWALRAGTDQPAGGPCCMTS